MNPAGLLLPELSQFDPLVDGEGSLDPMGLAAISDRLADRLVPGVRSRMLRIQFVSAMAVGAVACEPLLDDAPVDDVSTAAICFEWLVIEAFVRRISISEMPRGVPGSQKARAVIGRQQRLSAGTYLKGPSVFGFNGVYKPFAIDSGIVSKGLEPGVRCAEIVRAWEHERGFPGFIDGVPGSDGGRLRTQIRDQVRAALSQGRCTTKPGSSLFGLLASSLRPDHARAAERRVLRSFVITGEHERRSELVSLLTAVEGQLNEAELLEAVRPNCSAGLGSLVDAVVAYERFATLVDAAFRTLCAVSRSLGTQPLTPKVVESDAIVVRAARDLPGHFRTAAAAMSAIGAEAGLEERLGEFAIKRSPGDLVELLFKHHEWVQQNQQPGGKRPWFEPLRDGYVVRGPYAALEPPELGTWFVHPVRVAALRRFIEDTKV